MWRASGSQALARSGCWAMVAVTLSWRAGSPMTSSCAGVAVERSTGGMRGEDEVSPAACAIACGLAVDTKASRRMEDVRIAVS